jgi:hypothetical protein
VVAQNIDCYNSDGWKYLFNTGDEMMQLIEYILRNQTNFKEAVEFGRSYADKYYLKDHLDELVTLYTTPYGDPKRKEHKFFYENNREQFEVKNNESNS